MATGTLARFFMEPTTTATDAQDSAPPTMDEVAAWLGARGESAEGRDPAALLRRYRFESIGPSDLGAVLRKGVKPTVEAARRLITFQALREADSAAPGGVARVILITEGAGNKTNRNFYSAAALSRSFKVFEGKKCFLNHPSTRDDDERPERDVREVCGWFANTALESYRGKTAVAADLHFTKNHAGREAHELIASALEYQRQYPSSDDVLVGFSINASGASHEEIRDEEAWNVVESIDDAFSTDLVTFPARGGRVLALRESVVGFREAFCRAMAPRSWRARFCAEVYW